MKRLAVMALMMSLAVAVAPADDGITIDGDADLLSVRVVDAALVDVAEMMARQLAIEITVPEVDDTSVSADISGSLEEVLAALLPRQNFLIEYAGGEPVRLAVFDLDAASRAGGPTVTIAPPRRAFNAAPAAAGQPAPSVDHAPVRAVRRVGGVTQTAPDAALPPEPAKPGTASGDAPPAPQPQLSPAQQAAIDAAAATLRRQSATELETLVRDLQAICPPGHTC